MTPQKKINIAASRVSIQHPFFGRFLLDMNLIETDQIPTMATDGKKIIWNPEFVDKMNIKETMGVLIHEICHIVFKHHLRLRHRKVPRWNAATDYVIDPIVLSMKGVELPKGPGLEQHHDTKWDGHNSEHVYENIEDPPKMYAMGIGGIMEAKNEDGSSMSESEIEIAEQEIDQKVIVAAEAAKNIGKIPGAIVSHIKNLRKPQVDWENAIRRFFTGDKPEDFTMEFIDRSQFEIFGLIEPTVETKGVGHIVIAVDVSGSVSDTEIEHFLGEINMISEELMPDKITLIQCDSKIQAIETYDSGDFIETIRVKGRGGTRVQPVFKYVEENIFDHERLIYLTDMGVSDWGDAPSYPVMWVATAETSAPYGTTVPIKIGH